MIQRTKYLNMIEDFIDRDLIKVLVGVRRSGKTVLLSQIGERLRARGVLEEQLIYLNFESLQNAALLKDHALYRYLVQEAKQKKTKLYLLLDEIQEVEDWQRIINSLRVDLSCDIYLTGSNSKLLSGELATHLSGRYILLSVLPFDLREMKEFLQAEGTFVSDDALFADYLVFGGFPGRLQLRDRHSTEMYLSDLYEAVIIRDIVARHEIREVPLLKRLLSYLLDNVGNPFSIRSVTGTLVSNGYKVSVSTAASYIEYIKEAFVLMSAQRYDIIGKKLLESTEKYYAVDPGIRNINKTSEKIDYAKLYENLVYLKLIGDGYRVYIGKLDSREIDFIATRGAEKLYIQVAYLITDSDAQREFGNLEEIRDNYPKYVISSDPVDLSRNGIIHKNIIKFLLGE